MHIFGMLHLLSTTYYHHRGLSKRLQNTNFEFLDFKFSKFHVPQEGICIGERTIGFKGHISQLIRCFEYFIGRPKTGCIVVIGGASYCL